MALPNKYFLYEEAVQSPDRDVQWMRGVFREAMGYDARHLREDFCGTFQLTTEWVRVDESHTAMGLDLDPEPLSYGRKHHLSKLNSKQKKRVKILRQNVLSVTSPKADIVIAFNFSFNIFKKREQFVEYLRYCHKSLKTKGMVIFEMAGGPGMIHRSKETKKIQTKGGKKIGTYIWDQKTFNPVTGDGKYAIHFHLRDGRKMMNAFTYDWRVWSVTEIRDVMRDAGFDDTCVYWELHDKKENTTEFVRTENGENDWAYIAYVAGIKRATK